MMFSELFLYSLKSSVVLSILYLFYRLLFNKSTHFHVKRGVLLFIIFAAITLPLVQFRTEAKFVPEYPIVQYLDQERIFETGDPYQSTSDNSPVAGLSNEKKTKFYSWLMTAVMVYLAGMAIALLALLLEFVKISRIITFGKPRHDLHRRVVTHRLIRFPFSFWKWVFIPAKVSYDTSTWQLIDKHEQVHLRQFHSFDLLLSSLLKCIFWFNPIMYMLQNNIKDNHEALADREVLKSTNFTQYGEALLKVCLETGSLNLGHSFALKSNLSKRVKMMKLQQTRASRAIVAIVLMALVGFGLFTQTSLYGQELAKRDQMLAWLRESYSNFSYLANRKLSNRHQRVFDKIKVEYPTDSLNWTYLPENAFAEYTAKYHAYKAPLYFDQLMKSDKEDLIRQIEADTSRMMINGIEFYSYEFGDQIKEQVKADKNYLLFYKRTGDPFEPENQVVYEMDEVDVLPEPIGGLDNFARAIAMDCNIPEGLDRDRLPEFIEFEFVIHGSRHYSESNLLTELKGSDKKNKEAYKFFGEVYTMIKRKIGTVYAWRQGMKDGRPVNVRMVFSIPTKYM